MPDGLTHVNPDTSTALTITETSQSFARLRLGQFTQDVITRLETCEDAEILLIRANSKSLGEAAWKIEVACDGEIFNRVQAKRGRGNKDVKGIGVMAAVSKRAKEVGCTPATIFKNAQIFRLLQVLQRDGKDISTLNEKGFYLAALGASNPVEAINLFVEAKTSNPKFKVSDAFRLLKSKKLTKVQVASKAVAKVRAADPKHESLNLVDHIELTLRRLEKEIIPSCPDLEFAERFYAELVSDLKDHLSVLFDEDVAAALKQAYSEGCTSEKEMVQKTGFPSDTVSRIMEYLSDLGEFVEVDPTDKSRVKSTRVGNPNRTWRRV